jgi:hypothetical protein
MWLHVRMAPPPHSRFTSSSLAVSVALVTVSCGARPSDLQANVRAAARHEGAVRALRLVPAPEADQLLGATLRRDRDPTVRAAAIFAAGFRSLDPLVDAIMDTARRDPIDYVRAGAVTLLARDRLLSPRIDRALTDIASNDPDPGLRRLANGEAH